MKIKICISFSNIEIHYNEYMARYEAHSSFRKLGFKLRAVNSATVITSFGSLENYLI